MNRPYATLAIIAAVVCSAALAHGATFLSTGIIDEQTNQTNSIAADPGGTLAAYKATVAAAYANDTGGVVNFDLPNGGTGNFNNQTSFTVGYGQSNTKELTVTSSTAGGSANGQMNFTTFSTLTPISGSSTDSKGAIPTDSSSTAWRLAFSGLPTGEVIDSIGFTVLSRDSKAQTFRLEVFADGDIATPFTTVNETILAGKGVDDTFYSFSAPSGSAITSFRITFDTGNVITADDRLGLDDLAFTTTTAVPEPGTWALLLSVVGCALLLTPRRVLRHGF